MTERDAREPEEPSSRGMTRRVWFRNVVLPFGGIVILGLVLWRERQEAIRDALPPEARPLPRRFAPRFQANDHRSKLVKFERYLGRTRIVLVFFDGDAGADQDPVLRPLLEHHTAIEDAGIQVVAVSMATPYANRQAEQRWGQKFPFPVVTDIDPTAPYPASVHRSYGRYDEKGDRPLEGLFLIDRRGTVAMDDNGVPVPVNEPEAAVAALIAGTWPKSR